MFIACPQNCERLVECSVCNCRLCSRDHVKLCSVEGYFFLDEKVYCVECWEDSHQKTKLSNVIIH
jgi:hypothetical protein